MSLETNEFERDSPNSGPALQAMGARSEQWGESDVGLKSMGGVGIQGWGNTVDQTGMLRSEFESLDTLAHPVGTLRGAPSS